MSPRLPHEEAYILDTLVNFPQPIDATGYPIPNNVRIVIDHAPDKFFIHQLVNAVQTLFAMQYIFDAERRIDPMSGRIVVTPAGLAALRHFQAQQSGYIEKPPEPDKPKTDLPEAFREFGNMEVD